MTAPQSPLLDSPSATIVFPWCSCPQGRSLAPQEWKSLVLLHFCAFPKPSPALKDNWWGEQEREKIATGLLSLLVRVSLSLLVILGIFWYCECHDHVLPHGHLRSDKVPAYLPTFLSPSLCIPDSLPHSSPSFPVLLTCCFTTFLFLYQEAK